MGFKEGRFFLFFKKSVIYSDGKCIYGAVDLK